MNEERQRIAAEREKILKSREEIGQKERNEIERRDFMKMIRATAENVRGIV